MSSSYFDRERTALVRLTDAVRTRAEAEAQLAAAFQAGSDKAEREVSRARKANAAAREKELAEIDAAHAKAVHEIATRFDAEQHAAIRARDQRRVVIVDKFKAAEQRGRTEYQDKLWSLDSLFEAGEKKARDQMESLQRKAAAGKERVEELWTEADEPLARAKVKRAAVDHAGEVASASDDDFAALGRVMNAVADHLIARHPEMELRE